MPPPEPAPLAVSHALRALGALGGGFDVGVRRVFARVDVAQVAEHVHRLVIAEHHVQLAARGARFALQAHEQVHDLARVVAAIEQVAQAHHVRASGAPAVLRVDDARSRAAA